MLVILAAGIDRSWRYFATALGFTLFALCALGVGLVIAPLARLCSGNRALAQRRVRRSVKATCRGFITLLKGLRLIDYRFIHAERLQRPGSLVLANHPTLLDALFLLATAPDAICVAKGGLANHFVTRSVIRAAGFIADPNPRRVIAAASEALENGQSVILFPEGTRSIPGQPIRLRRNGAMIAAMSRAPIIPVRIRCEPPTLLKGSPWYRVPPRRPSFTFDVGRLVQHDDSENMSMPAVDELNRRLEIHFINAV
ncbi:lysophospholipid acyltransferase family protein [Modicisalibacter luteus]|uniref:Lysophospholipid acyltransferase family protein n=1 Tax=Modicisalibacter luteus TaxID=453962 RepID=A0ABV7LZC8_9GAMM|nr:lysophospholipid acyltransferase family protein [Halomonas lutea]GHA96800.1 acyltransferase [Halomonas lutea]